MRSAAARIVLNLAEIAALARQQPIALKVGNQPVEITFEPQITASLLLGLMVDLLGSGKVVDPDRPPDPPEAVEFRRWRPPKPKGSRK